MPSPSRRTSRAALLVAALLATSLAACAPAGSGAAPRTGDVARVAPPAVDTAAFLDTLQRRTFDWFWETTNPRNGLTPDRWPTKSFSSVAAVGFALTAYPIGVERGWVTREQAAERTLRTLRFFWNAPQGADSVGVTGHQGFFYHFLDMESGLRFRDVELSTIDTTLLLGGVLVCQQYFARDTPAEREIRALADSLYQRANWAWTVRDAPLVSMGWRPERGWIESDWKGYDESTILYVLALASPTYPVAPAAWEAYTRTYRWGTFHGYEHVNFAPLFGHQYSHLWIDFRGIQDAYMRGKGIDYFENARRATLAQRAHAIRNPGDWKGYDAQVWGLTASDGPIDTTMVIRGRARTFHTYWARGAALADIRDDGTIVPTAAGGSVPFAPEIAIPALMTMRDRYGSDLWTRYGFLDAFNPTFDLTGVPLRHGRVVPGKGWFDGNYLGIDQGPILIMIENHRTGMIWELMRRSPHIARGLCRAGFTGGWLEGRCD
ncbi:MAG TPA: glucoamylase family protein [Gemmatimonadaceae bacterium]|nr:glucoamylase family protein [Gemmatimonadaceae bacterium]